MTDDMVYFRFVQNEKVTTTLLKSDRIQSIRRGYFSSTPLASYNPYKPQIQLRIVGGSSRRLVKIGNEATGVYRDYQQGLKSGYQLDLNGMYYPRETLGFGIKYISAWFSNSMNDVYFAFPDGSSGYFAVSDNIAMRYLGPAVVSRLYLNDALYFRSEISLGYLGYKDKGEFIERLSITGSTMGFYVGASLDYSFTDQVGITGQISLLRGLLTKIQVNSSSLGSQVIELEEEEQENLSRLDFSIGLFLTL